MNAATLKLVELNDHEMAAIDGGIAPLVVWVGYGLISAGAGVAVGYLIAS